MYKVWQKLSVKALQQKVSKRLSNENLHGFFFILRNKFLHY